MLRIGFSNKYFTLWNVNEINNGEYIIIDNQYIQNLSVDEEKAKKKAKELGVTNFQVENSLRGKYGSFKTKKYIKKNYTDTQFKFGKYEGTKINDNTDVSYLLWYYKETNNEWAKNRIIELDDTYLDYKGELITFDEYDEIKKSRELLDEIKTTGTYEGVITQNPSFDGVVNVNGVYFKFEEVVERWFRSWEYYLPMKSGKAVRIKNKTVKFDVKFNTEYGYFEVLNFDIIKK